MTLPSARAEGKAPQRLWQMLLLALMATACWFAFDPTPHPPAQGHADKWQHLLAFITMAVCARPALGGEREAAGALLAFGVFIELVQAFIPSRTASVADVLADALGIALGLTLLRLWRRRWPTAR